MIDSTAPRRDPEAAELQHLQQIAGILGPRLLEIGCGVGRLTWILGRLSPEIIAVDPELASLQEALAARPVRLRRKTPFLQAKAEHLPFPKERFDTAIFAWSL